MQNLTSRAQGGALNARCLADHPSDPHQCFMSVHLTQCDGGHLPHTHTLLTPADPGTDPDPTGGPEKLTLSQ